MADEVGADAGTRDSAERIAEFEAALAERDAENARLRDQVVQLAQQVAELTERLNQNSRNSHLPPSSDGPGAGARRGTPSGKKQKSSAREAARRAVEVRTANWWIPSTWAPS